MFGSVVTAQRIEDGTQYYRSHPEVTALAERRLAERLAPYDAHPWTRWQNRSR